MVTKRRALGCCCCCCCCDGCCDGCFGVDIVVAAGVCAAGSGGGGGGCCCDPAASLRSTICIFRRPAHGRTTRALAHSLQAPDPRNSSLDGLGFAVVSFGQGRQKSDMLLLLMLLMLLPMLLLLLLLGTVAEGIGAMDIRGDEWEGEGQSVVCHMCVMGAVATGSHRLAYISIKR